MRRQTTVALLYPATAQWAIVPTRARAGSSPCSPLKAAGIAVEPAVYHDDFADEVAIQLHRLDRVLVWHNPIKSGRRREHFDAMLREVALRGALMGAHLNGSLRLGTKDVLLDLCDLPDGSDLMRVDSLDRLAKDLPRRSRTRARVLKQHRGHRGIGVWRVEAIAHSMQMRVQHAQSANEEEDLNMPALLQRMAPYFETATGGHMLTRRGSRAW